MKATTVYALLKKQISSVASGISDIEAEGSNLIFTLNDGTTITVDIPAPPGADVIDIEIDANNHLIFTFSDGDVKDAGEIPLDPRMDNIVPEEFSPSKSYIKDKMVMHDNKMYICNSVTPIAGTWDVIGGAFDEVDISSAISTKISNVVPSGTSGGLEPSSDAGKVMTWGEYGGWQVQEVPNNIADVYDPTLVYNTGDCCMYKGTFYQCNTDSTTGTWDSSKWDPTTVFQSVSDGKELIADAITDKGVPTSASDTFQDMADNIAQISSIEVVPLTANENKTYTAEEGKAYSPVTVAVEPDLTTKSITANGIYKASDDDADGYSEVTVNVSGSADHAMLNGVLDRTITSVSSNDVTEVKEYALYSCKNLTSIDFPNLTKVGSNGIYGCSNLTSINIPKVTEIAYGAIQGNMLLQTIDLPNTLTTIGGSAFSSCRRLARITIRATTPPTLSNVSAFNGIHSDYKIYVPSSSITAYQTATNWSSIASHIVEISE